MTRMTTKILRTLRAYLTHTAHTTTVRHIPRLLLLCPALIILLGTMPCTARRGSRKNPPAAPQAESKKNHAARTPFPGAQTGKKAARPDTPNRAELIELTTYVDPDTQEIEPKKIHAIVVRGNRTVPEEAIRAKVPYRVGGTLKPQLSSDLIQGIYDMGYFKPDIKVSFAPFSPTEVTVYVTVHEKNLIDEISFDGNDNMTADEIDKKIKFSELKSIDEDDLYRLEKQIKELYLSKDYHQVIITPEIIPAAVGHIKVIFHIDEGPYTLIRRVIFKGNTCISSKKLRALLFTRESWPFGFLNKAGSYQPDALEYDKSVIANYYRSNGFLTAQVTDVVVEKDPENPCYFCITFYIHEGDQYVINKVSAEANELCSEAQILSHIFLFPGDLYSSEKVRGSIEELRLVYGESGYIFADTNIETDVDEENKTVNLKFVSVLGKPITANRISITGNKKTREKVIRREIQLDEGELVTTRGMDDSKERVERLGFFDQHGGVNWKVTRTDESQADLDLNVKETKTGRVWLGLRSGGNPKDIQDPTRSVQLTGGISDSNVLGTGIKGGFNFAASWQDQQLGIQVINPWLFDRPISFGFDLFYESATYSEIRHFNEKPRERRVGGDVLLGWSTPRLGGLSFLGTIGAESLHFQRNLEVTALNPFEKTDLQRFQNYAFQSGTIPWIEGRAVQDRRNNALQPSRGYMWTTSLKFGIPHHHSQSITPLVSAGLSTSTQGFGFIKWDADAHWYYPVINEYDLIFHLHGHAGIVTGLWDFGIPYRELYHVGGPGTVRGFLFGQIGPTLFGDSIGGTKAFWMNAELIFPFTKDYNIVGLAFYDGGASWDAPDASAYSNNGANIHNNQFKFRQAIGLGLRLKNPMPVSLAVGLKLDRDRRSGERISEFHFTSSTDF